MVLEALEGKLIQLHYDETMYAIVVDTLGGKPVTSTRIWKLSVLLNKIFRDVIPLKTSEKIYGRHLICRNHIVSQASLIVIATPWIRSKWEWQSQQNLKYIMKYEVSSVELPSDTA